MKKKMEYHINIFSLLHLSVQNFWPSLPHPVPLPAPFPPSPVGLGHVENPAGTHTSKQTETMVKQ